MEHGIITMKKHVTINEHGLNLVKYLVHKSALEGKDSGKNKNVSKLKHPLRHPHKMFWKFEALPKKCHHVLFRFIENLVLMIVEGYIPLSIMENSP
jgi:hypothetical protein